MVIGVISDTHRNTYIFNRLYQAVEYTDMLIHLGDNVQDVRELSNYYKKEIIFVKGNCDFSTTTPNEIIEDISGKRFLITHGHNYGVKFSLLKLKLRAEELGVDIVLFGHTHVSTILFENGIWYINPGSPSLSRDGFNSYAIIEIKEGKVNPSIRSL